MPGLRIATASGNWSNSATWDLGLAPGLGDTVCANGFTVTIDQDVNVGQLTTGPADLSTGITPTMTSNTTPSGYIADASSFSSAGFEAFRAFDKAQGSGNNWRSGTQNAAWISYQFPTTVAINRYRFFTGGTSGRQPKDWTFEGWDGSSWIVLHTVTGANLAINTMYDSGLIGNATAYIRYRVNVTAVITINNAIEISELYLFELNYTTFTGVAGGGFTITGSRNITCTNSSGVTATNTCITFNGPSPSIFNLTSSIVGGTTSAAVVHSGTGTLNIIGSVTGNSTSVASIPGVNLTSNGTTNIVGSVIGNGANAFGIAIAGSHVLNITGNVSGGGQGGSTGIRQGGACTINITGNILGSNANAAAAILLNANNYTLNITGNVSTQDGANTAAISTSSTGYMSIIGSLRGALGQVAVNSSSTTAINIFSGPFIHHQYGGVPFLVFRMHYIPTSGSYFEYRDNSTNGALSPGPIAPATYLYAPSTVISAPNQNNVRFGTVYASGSQTGQMRVPSASQVSIGIPVDNTVGTAVLSTNDVVNTIWNSSITELTASNSIGSRLKNVSTPDITANQIIGLI